MNPNPYTQDGPLVVGRINTLSTNTTWPRAESSGSAPPGEGGALRRRGGGGRGEGPGRRELFVMLAAGFLAGVIFISITEVIRSTR
jgi:hypothetical protein